MHPSLFPLHFNTPNISEAATRLSEAGLPLQRRFGSVRGEGTSLTPEEHTPDDFRLKLQVHQYGAVNITLAPGQHPHFDHLGLAVSNLEDTIDCVKGHGWSVRSNERRTFVMTPWQFRVELHPETGDVVSELGNSGEAHLEDVSLQVPDANAAREAFNEIFYPLSELNIEAGENPWIESFSVAAQQGSEQINVGALLGN